MYKKISG
jgi:hypothetical protein